MMQRQTAARAIGGAPTRARDRTRTDATWRSARLLPVSRPYLAPSRAQPTPRPVGGGVKRALDVAAAAAALTALAPVLGAISAAVALSDGGPPLYRHKRIGWNGRRFDCLKFRTMVPDAEAKLARVLAEDEDAAREWAETRKLRRDPRVTRIGDFLRRTSLDELPQLVNVLRGDMSLVGPRPVVRDELDRYGRRAGAYLAARPGVTGLWQISGRSDVGYRQRVRLDSHYVRSWTLARDLSILLMTAPAVLARRGSC